MSKLKDYLKGKEVNIWLVGAPTFIIRKVIDITDDFNFIVLYNTANNNKEFMRMDKITSFEIDEKMEPFTNVLLEKIVYLPGLSIRTLNALCNYEPQNKFQYQGEFIYVKDLTEATEEQMLAIPGFGRKSLNEIKLVLESKGLKFGMKPLGWFPNDE